MRSKSLGPITDLVPGLSLVVIQVSPFGHRSFPVGDSASWSGKVLPMARTNRHWIAAEEDASLGWTTANKDGGVVEVEMKVA